MQLAPRTATGASRSLAASPAVARHAPPLRLAPSPWGPSPSSAGAAGAACPCARPQPRGAALVAKASRSDSHAGHAFLHDFCMTIPFGAIAAAVGGVSLFLGMAAFGAKVASAGAAVLLASVLSLKTWKAGAGTTPYTLASAGAATAAAYACWQQAQLKGAMQWVAGPVGVLAAMLALFCVYNVAAGGNPPRKAAAA